MKKQFSALLGLLFILALPCAAQTHYTLSGTITIPSGAPMAGGSYTVQLVQQSGASYYPVQNAPLVAGGYYNAQPFLGTLSSAGAFSVSVIATNQFTGTYLWQILIGAPQDPAILTVGQLWPFLYNTAVTANTDVSAAMSALAPAVTYVNLKTGASSLNAFPAAPSFTNGASFGTVGTAVGQAVFNNATSGSITVTAPTGALGTATNTLALYSGGLPIVFSCGATGTGNQTCIPAAVNGKQQIYVGQSNLSSNSATITFPNSFTSTTSFFCVVNDVTTRANPIQMLPATASSATITNTTGAADQVQWICVGN